MSSITKCCIPIYQSKTGKDHIHTFYQGQANLLPCFPYCSLNAGCQDRNCSNFTSKIKQLQSRQSQVQLKNNALEYNLPHVSSSLASEQSSSLSHHQDEGIQAPESHAFSSSVHGTSSEKKKIRLSQGCELASISSRVQVGVH